MYSNRLIKKPKTMNLVRKKAKKMNLYKNYIPNNKRFSGKASGVSSSRINKSNKKLEKPKISDKRLNDMMNSIQMSRNSNFKISKNKKIYNTYIGIE